MTSNQNRKYSENQYKRTPDPIMESGFTNYERLLVELNNRMYYPQETYEKFLNENGLLAEETIDMYRKIETEFVTSGEAATSLRNRLKDLRAEINRIKAEMNYKDSDFSFMYYTR